MKKIVVILGIAICFLGMTFEIKACKPARIPFREWLSYYNSEEYMVVEGYFLPATEGNYATKLRVTRSSHSSIKVGQEYEVFEYGPFGNMCEKYEMRGYIHKDLVGKKHKRLLIAYTKRSVNGKLVTPIFWKEGVAVSNNKIIEREYEYDRVLEKEVFYEYLISLNKVWKQVLGGDTKKLEWKRKKIKVI
jgi:hypothetical protein